MSYKRFLKKKIEAGLAFNPECAVGGFVMRVEFIGSGKAIRAVSLPGSV